MCYMYGINCDIFNVFTLRFLHWTFWDDYWMNLYILLNRNKQEIIPSGGQRPFARTFFFIRVWFEGGVKCIYRFALIIQSSKLFLSILFIYKLYYNNIYNNNIYILITKNKEEIIHVDHFFRIVHNRPTIVHNRPFIILTNKS